MNTNDQDDYSLPVDHPKTAAVCGWIYEHVFEPINHFIEKLEARYLKIVRED